MFAIPQKGHGGKQNGACKKWYYTEEESNLCRLSKLSNLHTQNTICKHDTISPSVSNEVVFRTFKFSAYEEGPQRDQAEHVFRCRWRAQGAMLAWKSVLGLGMGNWRGKDCELTKQPNHWFHRADSFNRLLCFCSLCKSLAVSESLPGLFSLSKSDEYSSGASALSGVATELEDAFLAALACCRWSFWPFRLRFRPSFKQHTGHLSLLPMRYGGWETRRGAHLI